MSFDLLKGTFPIGGWVGPSAAGGGSPSFLKDEYFRLLKDSGINLMYANTEHNGSPDVIKGLELCDRYGIAYLVNDNRFRMEDFGEEDGLRALEIYRKHKSFVGIAVHDEPFLKDMESLRLARQRHRKVFEQTTFHTNLFPIIATRRELRCVKRTKIRAMKSTFTTWKNISNAPNRIISVTTTIRFRASSASAVLFISKTWNSYARMPKN